MLSFLREHDKDLFLSLIHIWAVRGETVDLRITKVMKTAAAGEIVKIRTSSPERVKPECPHYGTCGGCDFQHLSYAEELWAKRRRVQDALKRLGGTDLPVEEILRCV